MKHTKYAILFVTFICSLNTTAQKADSSWYWHNTPREIRYHPEGTDFVITNGKRRFTRALYGTNTAFRVEGGDLPEFALYMPGMGGNIKFGLIKNDSSKWLINARKITARYRPGKLLYDIEDDLLGKAIMHLEVLAMADAEGVIIQVSVNEVVHGLQLLMVYGGASGKKFSRDGDMGPDPESVFYLHPKYCTDNRFTITGNNFVLKYGSGLKPELDPYLNRNLPADTVSVKPSGKEKEMIGSFPPVSNLHIADAEKQLSPIVLDQSTLTATPVITGKLSIVKSIQYYYSVQNKTGVKNLTQNELATAFKVAELARLKLANRIVVHTPDPYINTLGGALGIAADAIWESPTYLHGSIGWRMRLNGWRGPYVADVLGWHDRARLHFRSYAKSQITSPDSGKIIADTALHLARQLEKLGTSLFSSGYISRNPNGDIRPHHYDMNLVYIDALLNHIKWTGDIAFIKEIFPVIKRHLAWEKRNFDVDGDGLYEAYAAIWASDALQYSGGGGTHSSAYNYRANKMAAQLAALIGEDPTSYSKEADKILKAITHVLWMPGKGWFAEFKDALGQKALHSSPALWTIYHSIDEGVTNPFQAWQSLQYIDHYIPHIPMRAKSLPDSFYTISTSNWMPYAWSLNNVALAELMNTSLAYWQGGDNETAFQLWKSSLLESMYLGGSPGNFQQITTYDAIRGEAYRDFSDPVAMTARSLVEGLFGIQPNALQNQLTIRPGFPKVWNDANLQTPDIKFDFKRTGNRDVYTIETAIKSCRKLTLQIKAVTENIQSITVNDKQVKWLSLDSAVGNPVLAINCGAAEKYRIKITWKGVPVFGLKEATPVIKDAVFEQQFAGAVIKNVYDPQQVLSNINFAKGNLKATVTADTGYKTVFVQLQQGAWSWWYPLSLLVKDRVGIIAANQQSGNILQLQLVNNTASEIKGVLSVKNSLVNNDVNVTIPALQMTALIDLPVDALSPGTNTILYRWNDGTRSSTTSAAILNWSIIDKPLTHQRMINLSAVYNDKVTHIFNNQYFSPRPATPSLQLPTQGIGEWTHPLFTVTINDAGLRKMAGKDNIITLPQGIQFQTPSDSTQSNILFTSQWDVYPASYTLPLSGSANHAYFLMAGSTNPMQSQMTNGAVIIRYTDGMADTLLLKNPENWWTIEQDYFDDGYAFKTNAAKPIRIHLKTGKIVGEYDQSINAFNGKMIDGGAATVLDLPLNPVKVLKELELQTWANDVVIGLMGLTLINEK
ncbi:hypothetical protein BH11BAC3_BH11BAC3_21120 [soil metagenome]